MFRVNEQNMFVLGVLSVESYQLRSAFFTACLNPMNLISLS